MGYFPNGTADMDYEEQYCSKCVHFKPDDGGCMVWLAHMAYNYDLDNKEAQNILNLLIPLDKDGLWNQECAMFYQAPNQRCTDTMEMF